MMIKRTITELEAELVVKDKWIAELEEQRDSAYVIIAELENITIRKLQDRIDAAVATFTKLAHPTMNNNPALQRALLNACRKLGPTAAKRIEEYCVEMYGSDFSTRHLSIKILAGDESQGKVIMNDFKFDFKQLVKDIFTKREGIVEGKLELFDGKREYHIVFPDGRFESSPNQQFIREGRLELVPTKETLQGKGGE